MYDAIIVGSGIGGLVCANYLAMGGKKVLVVEKNKEAGGYCTSFKRRGFVFDTTIHAIQSCAPGNILYKIFSDIGMWDQLQITRADPTDTLLLEGQRIHVMNNINETIASFQKVFPKESEEVDSFFKLIHQKDFLYIYSKFKRASFQEVLDQYFSSEDLKKCIGVFLSNIGSSPSNTSALSAFALIKQFILQGGYYPKGGMQKIPDLMVNQLKKRGGDIMLNSTVTQILIKNQKCVGVLLQDGQELFSRSVVSNSDLSFTFNKLIEKTALTQNFRTRLEALAPSYSIYIVYLTLNKKIANSVNSGPGLWYIPNDSIINDEINFENVKIMLNKTIFCSFASKLDMSLSPADKDQMRLMINTKGYPQSFWRDFGPELSNRLIYQVSKIIPGLKDSLICQGRATSITMQNYTFNRDGSICGWLNSPEQVNDQITNHIPKIKGLFFAGHWVTQRYGNGGVAMVADSGRKAAKYIIKELGGE